MEKTVCAIASDGQRVEIKLRATAAVPRLYRMKFHRDIMQDMAILRKGAKWVQQAGKRLKAAQETFAAYAGESKIEQAALAFALETARDEYEQWQYEAADLEIFENIAYVMALHADSSVPPTIDAWIEQFAVFSISEILPEVLELWGLNEETMAEAKKNTARLTVT